MNKESMALTLAGGLIGILALSAGAFAELHPPKAETLPAALAGETEPASAAAWMAGEASDAALPVLAEPEPAVGETEAGARSVAVSASDPIPGEKLFVCDSLGCPLEGIELNGAGKAVLGPFAPGCYSVQRGQTEVGSFRLEADGSLSETAGRVWTDGEQLLLERFIPGTARLTVTLGKPGYYTVTLCDRDGRARNRDLYIPEGTPPEGNGTWVRVLDVQGLAPGLYTAVQRNLPLGQVEVPAGEIGELAITIDD